MSGKLYYGLISQRQIRYYSEIVCMHLGYGKNGSAPSMLRETIAAETQYGTYPDSTTRSGHGLCQFDEIGFLDVQQRTRQEKKDYIKTAFRIDIDKLKVTDLDNDPFLSVVMCRLKYMLRPEPIPNTLSQRANYWKRFYNSQAGKGTIEHYMNSAHQHLYKTDYDSE